jgi:hypothetical protein
MEQVLFHRSENVIAQLLRNRVAVQTPEAVGSRRATARSGTSEKGVEILYSGKYAKSQGFDK